MQRPVAIPTFHPWPQRLAWLLAVMVFLLIWVGGNVTTYESGMAVPDWPTTNSYWFYPIKAWLAVWDVFLEHGHRLLAQGVGIVAVLLAILLWRDDRKWMRWVAVALVVGALVQGSLGGIRVLWNLRALARVHGCIAPLYFALSAAVVMWTSRTWAGPAGRLGLPPGVLLGKRDQPPPELCRWQQRAWLMVILVYLEIVLGALLRRPASTDTTFGDISPWLWLKVINAGLMAALATWLLIGLRAIAAGNPRYACMVGVPSLELPIEPTSALQTQSAPPVRSRAEHGIEIGTILARRAVWLAAVLALQLTLAAATWVTNYGWPKWFTDWIWNPSSTVIAQGRLQVLVTTGHTALGSLVFVSALSLALWLRRTAGRPAQTRCSA